MATLSTNGRIPEAIVDNEIDRLQLDRGGHKLRDNNNDAISLQEILSESIYEALDLFEQVQLAKMIQVCKESRSMSDAGRKLFNKSRLQNAVSNDSQRLAVYLKKYALVFKHL